MSEARTQERLLQMMLNDAFGAVEAIYGKDGLAKVTEQMRLTMESREATHETGM